MIKRELCAGSHSQDSQPNPDDQAALMRNPAWLLFTTYTSTATASGSAGCGEV